MVYAPVHYMPHYPQVFGHFGSPVRQGEIVPEPDNSSGLLRQTVLSGLSGTWALRRKTNRKTGPVPQILRRMRLQTLTRGWDACLNTHSADEHAVRLEKRRYAGAPPRILNFWRY